MAKEETKSMEMHHVINGVATDLLCHIDEFVKTEEDIPEWAEYLSKKCNISLEEAIYYIRNAMGWVK